MKSASTNAKRPRYVLIIEDNVHHAELLTEMLDKFIARPIRPFDPLGKNLGLEPSEDS